MDIAVHRIEITQTEQLRMSMPLYEEPTSQGYHSFSTKPDHACLHDVFLREDLFNWLADMDYSYSLSWFGEPVHGIVLAGTGTGQSFVRYQYFIEFDDLSHLMLFKLTWC